MHFKFDGYRVFFAVVFTLIWYSGVTIPFIPVGGSGVPLILGILYLGGAPHQGCHPRGRQDPHAAHDAFAPQRPPDESQAIRAS